MDTQTSSYAKGYGPKKEVPLQIISDFLNNQDFGIGSLYTKGKAAELIKELEKNGYVIALKDPSGIEEYYSAVKRNHKDNE